MDQNVSLETLLANLSIQFIEIIFYCFLQQTLTHTLTQISFQISSLFNKMSLKLFSNKSSILKTKPSLSFSLSTIRDQSSLSSLSSVGPSIPSSLGPIASSSSSSNRKTLVLDLDETLIHSTTRGTRYDFMVEVMLEGSNSSAHSGISHQQICYYVYKRPHLDYFLSKVSEWFTLVIFTASVAEYADPVIGTEIEFRCDTFE